MAPEGLFFVPTAGACPHLCVCVWTLVYTRTRVSRNGHQTTCLHANTYVWPVPFVHMLIRVPSWARAHACVRMCPSARARLCAHVLTCTVWVGGSVLGLTSGRRFPRGEFVFIPLLWVDGIDPGGVKDQL